LRSWLAQDISCPTCRVSLSEQKTRNLTEDEEVIRQMDDNNDAMVRHRDRPVRQDDEGIQNHFFEFDGKSLNGNLDNLLHEHMEFFLNFLLNLYSTVVFL